MSTNKQLEVKQSVSMSDKPSLWKHRDVPLLAWTVEAIELK